MISFWYHIKLYNNHMIESLSMNEFFFDMKHIGIHKGVQHSKKMKL